MSTSLTVVSRIGDQIAYQQTDALGTNTVQSASLLNKYQMAYGAAQDDANNTLTVPTKYYEGNHSITIASSTYDIDLTLLTDVFGTVLNFSKIYRIVVHNNDLLTGSGLILKSNATNGWVAIFNALTTGQILVPAGGDFALSSPRSGFNVTAGSKVLRIVNDAASPSGSASFNLHLIGS